MSARLLLPQGEAVFTLTIYLTGILPAFTMTYAGSSRTSIKF